MTPEDHRDMNRLKEADKLIRIVIGHTEPGDWLRARLEIASHNLAVAAVALEQGD